METRDLYGDYLCMKLLYGILWFRMETICVWNSYGSVCMDVSSSIPRV